jgi:hypothetical protein
MASELPYFRFTVQDWQNGKISLENYELQGLFISICGYYWINDCSITLAMLEKKFRDAKDLLKQLIDLGILKHENRHDKIEIEFLNLQYDLLSEKRKRRQVAGSMGGNAKAMLKQKCSYKDNNKDNNKDNILLPLKEANEAVTVNDNVTVTVIDKEKDFYNQISEFKEKYSKEMLRAFFNHWSQKNKKGKMKFEGEKFFEVGKRLATWKLNEAKFSKPSFEAKTETIKPKISHAKASAEYDG